MDGFVIVPEFTCCFVEFVVFLFFELFFEFDLVLDRIFRNNTQF